MHGVQHELSRLKALAPCTHWYERTRTCTVGLIHQFSANCLKWMARACTNITCPDWLRQCTCYLMRTLGQQLLGPNITAMLWR